MLTLQHERQKGKSYRSFAPIEWSESLRVWCVFDPKSIIAILRSPHFDVVEYATEYARLEKRTGIDWSGLVGALNSIPLANEGDRHAKLRRDFAQLIAARSASAKQAVGKFLAQAVSLTFKDRRRAELVGDLIQPANDVLFGELLGQAVPKIPREGPSVSQVFDRFLSLNRRKLLQDSLARLTESFAQSAPDLTTSVEYATALTIVGYDSLLGSIGTSLVAILEDSAPARLCDINYPDALPRTGVPYVERVARKEYTIDGITFRPEDRLRLFLDACPVRGGAGDEAPFFGKGRHLCLGKDLSQEVWRTLVRELAQLPLRVSVDEARIRPNDYVFTVYEAIEVTIDE